MSLRVRLTLGAAAAVAVAVVLASALSFVLVEDQLRDQLDQDLEDQAARLVGTTRVNELFALPVAPRELRSEEQLLQLVLPDGSAARPIGQRSIPIDAQDRTLAATRGDGGQRLQDARIGATEMRVLTVPTGRGFAIQVARPTDAVDATLENYRVTLALVSLGGIGLAAALGFVVARTGLRPVERLTAAAEHVAQTQDLQASIDGPERGEVGRLARAFNAMLAALDGSRRQQRQLVTDASHELRTPLTSLRTNLEVLAAQPDMPIDERSRLLADVDSQLVELTELVDDVVELAREETVPETAFTDVHLDELVTDAVERARRHAPALDVRITRLDAVEIRGQQQPIERALANILDNACKWSTDGAAVEVALAGREVSVRDHGPGIDPEDLPHVFDRFYRSAAARSLPGSGLGLSIVRRVMEQHGGVALAETAEGGGARLRLVFPDQAGTDDLAATRDDD